MEEGVGGMKASWYEGAGSGALIENKFVGQNSSGAAVEQNFPFQFHMTTCIHSEILGKVHTSLKCLLHCRWCQAVTLLHIAYDFFFYTSKR